MRELLVSRRGVVFDEQWVGPWLELPAEPTAETLGLTAPPPDPAWVGLAEDDTLPRVLGLDRELPSYGRIDAIRPWGLHEPTAWERRIVNWLALHLGVPDPLETPAQTQRGPLSGFADTLAELMEPWPATPPTGLELLRAQDPDLEALAAVRWLRRLLLEQPADSWEAWLDGVLLLVPDDPARQATWRRRLEEGGLPVISRGWTALADTLVGRWLIATSRLYGGSSRTFSREDLVTVLETPVFRMAEGGRRADLRLVLRDLRRPRLRFDLLINHARSWFERRIDDLDPDDESFAESRDALEKRQESLLQLLNWLVEAVGPDSREGLWGRMLELIGQDRLALSSRLGATQDLELLGALKRARELLRALSHSDDDPTQEPHAVLASAFAGSGSGGRTRPVHGVRLQSWSGWDGRPADTVVLSGLEEGGFPRGVAPRGLLDRELVRLLDLDDPSAELERQVRVLAHALRLAGSRALMSWSEADSEGSATYPGAMLAGLPSKKDDPRFLAWSAVTLSVTERHLTPDGLAEAWLPSELRMQPLPEGEQDEAWRLADAAERHHQCISSVRAPSEPGVAPTPHSGVIGAPVPERTWSPTTLEDLGQCPVKFLLGRLLRAERHEDAGSMLDPMETGSLVHDSLALAAKEANERGEPWRLQPSNADEPIDALVQVRASEIETTAAGLVDELSTLNPTLGPGIVDWTTTRWQRALRVALMAEAGMPRGGRLRQNVRAVSALREAELDVIAEINKDAEKAVQRYREVRDQAPRAVAFINELVALAPANKSRAKAAAVDLGIKELGRVLTQKAVQESIGAEGLDAEGLRMLVAEKLAAAESKVAVFLERALDEDRLAVPREVLAAEWSFGSSRGGVLQADDSVDEPLVLPLEEGRDIRLKGRVDRIDGDAQLGRLAIVDYKTGKSHSDGWLTKMFAEGRHLQLPIYAHAARELLCPMLGWSEQSAVEQGRLAYPRHAKDAALDLSKPKLLLSDESTDPGEEHSEPTLSADDILRSHLDHTRRRLDSGVLPLVPRACPARRDKDAYCDFEPICGFDANAPSLEDPQPQPSFVAPPKESKGSKKTEQKLGKLARLLPTADPPSAESAREAQAEAMKTVLSLDQNVVVSAGAGSGKTTALVKRYVTALRAGLMPDQVLAITFTRKATAEMRFRVRAKLLEPDVIPDPHHRRACLLALASAPILTIDAFAARVAQLLASDPDTALAVSASTSRFTEDWLDERLVEHTPAPSADLQRLLERLPLRELRAQILALLGVEGERLRDLATLTPEALCERWITAFERACPGLDDDADKLRAIRDGLAALLEGDLGKDAGYVQGLHSSCDEVVAEYDSGDILSLLGALRAMSVTTAGMKTVPEAGPMRDEINAIRLRWIDEKVPTRALADVTHSASKSGIAPSDALLEEADTALAAVRIAEGWKRELDAERERAGVYGFDDILRLATRLLIETQASDATEAATLLPFHHILVDEFQDTNRAQVRLIDTLRATLEAGGLTPRLFLVGDPKQSIYRFRGAEVDVFEAEQAKDEREVVALNACWRARPPLTRAIDRLFERVLKPRDLAGEPTDPLAVVPWQALAPRWEAPDDEPEECGPCVELLRIPEPASPEPSEEEEVPENDEQEDEGPDLSTLEIETVVARLQQIRFDRPDWSIGVLTHSWLEAARWGQHLQDHGIPVHIQGGRGLLEDPAVAPLVQALDALEREDDFGVVAVLRGPLVGMSDAGLWAARNGAGVKLPWQEAAPTEPRPLRLASLRHGFTFDADRAATWLEAQRERSPEQSVLEALQTDQERIAEWSEWWATAMRSFGLEPLERTLGAIIERSGYRRVLYAQGGVEARLRLAALRRLERWIGKLSADSNGGAAEVVRELRRLGKAQDDPAASSNPHEGEAVTVTVVHQAKGLAWDVVVLPSVGKASAKSRVGDLAPIRILDENNQELLLPVIRREKPNDLFATEQGIGAALTTLATAPWERAEQRRLLYVACTRARERLVLAGGLPTSSAEAERLLVKLGARVGPTDEITHRLGGAWAVDLFIALGITPAAEEEGKDDSEPSFDPGAWVEKRDFRWVDATLTKVERVPKPASPPPSDLEGRLSVVQVTEQEVLNPSSAHGGVTPDPLPEQAPAAGNPPGAHPFDDARVAGSVVHRALALHAWREDAPAGLCEAAILDELDERITTAAGFEETLPAKIAWVKAMIANTSQRQPALAAALTRAAARGDVLHELRVQVDQGETRVEGFVDLLWRDDDGAWHLLDYKATEVDADAAVGGDGLEARIRHYHPQVSLYATALEGRLPEGQSLASYGLWFVREGRVVRWAVGDGREEP